MGDWCDIPKYLLERAATYKNKDARGEIDGMFIAIKYVQGMCDEEITKQYYHEKSKYISQRVVVEWRKANNLYQNLTDDMLFREYAEGHSDRQIARKLDSYANKIKTWRKKHQLPPADVPITDNEYETKPWKDPESLFCDGDFLEKLTGKKIKIEPECQK